MSFKLLAKLVCFLRSRSPPVAVAAGATAAAFAAGGANKSSAGAAPAAVEVTLAVKASKSDTSEVGFSTKLRNDW